jgi:hypothetical protein
MKTRRFKFVFFGPLAILLLSGAVLLLWNWLVPCIFGFAAINYWQALGLLVLARIFFGGFGGRRDFPFVGHHDHNPIREKWLKMTPEEREKYVKSRHFGHHPFGNRFFDRNDFETFGDKNEEPKKEG